MLPKISKEVFQTKAQTYSDTESIYLTIKRDNPFLWLLIETVLNSDMSTDKKDGYCKAAAQFYSMLLAQAEVDDLNNSWGKE